MVSGNLAISFRTIISSLTICVIKVDPRSASALAASPQAPDLCRSCVCQANRAGPPTHIRGPHLGVKLHLGRLQRVTIRKVNVNDKDSVLVRRAFWPGNRALPLRHLVVDWLHIVPENQHSSLQAPPFGAAAAGNARTQTYLGHHALVVRGIMISRASLLPLKFCCLSMDAPR